MKRNAFQGQPAIAVVPGFRFVPSGLPALPFELVARMKRSVIRGRFAQFGQPCPVRRNETVAMSSEKPLHDRKSDVAGESSWAVHFPGNLRWSNAMQIVKGMTPYGAVAM